MNDRADLSITADHGFARLDACALQSHDGCEPEGCEVAEARELCEQLTAGQIRIGVATAISGILVSTVFALCVLAVWCWHAFHGNEMPKIPLLITSIAGAPFAAGVITTLRIPKKARLKWEQK